METVETEWIQGGQIRHVGLRRAEARFGELPPRTREVHVGLPNRHLSIEFRAGQEDRLSATL